MTEKPGASTKILLVRLSALGDVVHALPALRVLRESLPSAEIHWLVEDRCSALLEDHPDLNRLWVYERSQLHVGNALPIIWSLRSELRGESFGWVFDFQGNAKSAMFVQGTRSPKRVGFDKGYCREFNHLFTNVHVKPEGEKVHRVEKNLALLQPLVAEPTYMPPRLPSSESDRKDVQKILARLTHGHHPVVLMHPGTSAYAAFKRWPAERYGMLARELASRLGAKTLLSHGAGEDKLVKKAVAASEGAAAPLPRGGGLRRLAEMIRNVDLFVGADTGPMHIAAALQVPVVALFGPKDPTIYGPYGTRSEIVRKELPCSPCTKRKCPNPICMTQITVEEVTEACERILKSSDEKRE